jgi:two-component system KDP operon response regulator KdpE
MSVEGEPPFEPEVCAPGRPVVLLVEDEPAMRKFVERALVDHGFRVLTAQTGRDALSLAASHNPDIVILDLGLPDMDGLEVTVRLREWSAVPILVVSAREQQSDKVTALDAGANDFVTKPFGVPELLARIRVWLRQTAIADAESSTSVKDIGDLRVDFGRRVVTVGGNEVHLTRTEYKLLTLFVRNAGKVLSHKQILESVWGPRHAGDAQYVRVYMGQLRRKVERNPARPRYLVTESGVGYRLKTDSA